MTPPFNKDSRAGTTGDGSADGQPLQEVGAAWDRILRRAVDWSILLDDDPNDRALRAEFEAWLAEDPVHDQAWQKTTRASHLISQTKHVAPPAAAGRRMGAATRRTRTLPRARLLAALAATIVFAWFAAPHAVLRFNADHMTGTAEQKTITLSDGSSVRLAPESALSFADTPMARGITLLSGEAYFDVIRDPARPFTVTAEEASITVLGTGFNVRLGADMTDVAVKHGRVRVDAESGAKDSVTLQAGQWARVSIDGRTRRGVIHSDAVGGWTENRIVAIDRRLSDVLADLRRYYTGTIVLTDEALAQRSVTGVFDVSDPAAAAGVIVTPHGGKVRQITPWVIVVSSF